MRKPMRYILAAVFCFGWLVMLAQDKPVADKYIKTPGDVSLGTPNPSAKLEVPPTISAEHRAKYWRSQADLISLQTALEKAQIAASVAIKDMKADCGSATLLGGKDGEPSCQVNTEAAKTPEPTKP